MGEVKACIENEEGIWSINQVKGAVLAKHDCVLPRRLVASVLRDRFGMRFHKVKRVAFKGNSERSLVVRQQCAKKMLELLDQGTRVVNVDESWVNPKTPKPHEL